MSEYYDKYKKYLDKYLFLKRMKKTHNKELKVVYNFIIVKDGTLKIEISANENIDWFLGEQWCTDDLNDKIILNKTDSRIEYEISKDIPQFKDDRLYCYPMVRNEKEFYACFTGVIGLYLPSVEDDFVTFSITFKTNYPLFVSGIGLIEDQKTLKTNLFKLKNQLFVFTKSYEDSENVLLTYKKDSYFFVDKELMIKNVSDFIEKCYSFFCLKEDVKFLVNYNGYLLDKKETITGYGGNGNYAGFNYLVTEKRKTKEIQEKINIYLLHELYHHFNRSSGYQSNWFSEGFTEFFSRYLSMDKKSFIKECNKFIELYWKNPYKNSKIDIMTRENFWNNKFIERLPYVKGFVYALYNLQRYKTEFIERYKTIIVNRYKNPQLKEDNALLNDYLKDDNFDKYILKGKTIKIKGDYTKKINSLNIGFDLDTAIYKKKITNIKKELDAYKKGVRNGEVEQIEINEKEGTILIKQNKKTITVNIFTGIKIDIPQIEDI